MRTESLTKKALQSDGYCAVGVIFAGLNETGSNISQLLSLRD